MRRIFALVLFASATVFADDIAATLELAKKGDVKAQVAAATYYYGKRDFKKAADWYEKASNQGDFAAEYQLG
jgi:TPR repeat protein